MNVATPGFTTGFDADQLTETKPVMQVEPGELHDRLARDGVIAFRRQSIGDGDMLELLGRLGKLTFTQGECPVERFPDLNVVSNVGKQDPKSVFHSDTSYVQNTPAYTMLRPIELPERGGATLFTNQSIAWRHLPETIRDRLADVEALHVVTGLDESNLDETSAWHPIARRHPRSGEAALFLTTPKRCRRLRDKTGQTIVQSERIIDALYRHSIRRCPIYRHQWQPGDLVIWDNRCTMHRGDHDGVVGNRVFHRGMSIDNVETHSK